MIKKFGKDFQNLTIDGKSYQLTTVATPTGTLPQSSSLANATSRTGSATGNTSGNHQTQWNPTLSETNATDVRNDTPAYNSSASTVSSKHTSFSPEDAQNRSVSVQNHSVPRKRNTSTGAHSSGGGKHRKRRHAKATHSFPVMSKIQTLPLYRVKNNVSQFRYSGKVSILPFCNSQAGPNTRLPISRFFS